ncbi:hypothetical protein CB1_000949018 [Camelus ferus]|nr:hypothetical protein CB1_000949018 [Camelus ferus]
MLVGWTSGNCSGKSEAWGSESCKRNPRKSCLYTVRLGETIRDKELTQSGADTGSRRDKENLLDKDEDISRTSLECSSFLSGSVSVSDCLITAHSRRGKKKTKEIQYRLQLSLTVAASYRIWTELNIDARREFKANWSVSYGSKTARKPSEWIFPDDAFSPRCSWEELRVQLDSCVYRTTPTALGSDDSQIDCFLLWKVLEIPSIWAFKPDDACLQIKSFTDEEDEEDEEDRGDSMAFDCRCQGAME